MCEDQRLLSQGSHHNADYIHHLHHSNPNYFPPTTMQQQICKMSIINCTHVTLTHLNAAYIPSSSSSHTPTKKQVC